MKNVIMLLLTVSLKNKKGSDPLNSSMSARLARSITLILILCCSACDGDKGSPQAQIPSASQTPEPVNIESWRKIDTNYFSSITGIDYPIHIFLPDDYQQETAQENTYPVIYATDGQWIFDGFADTLERKGYQAILVAIEQGPNDRRAIDYLMPGAANYFKFLISELMPFIESQYRVNTNERTLSGTSYGGLFTGTALLLDDVSVPHFKNILSFDGSFSRNWTTTQQLETDRYNASQNMNVTLVLTAATGFQGNKSYVDSFYNLLRSRNYIGLTIYRYDYPVVHEAVADPSFESAVDVIF